MTEGGGGGRGSQGGRGDEVSATEVRERVSVSWAEQLQAAHISPGIYICSVLFLHRLISHMHVFVPPLPNSPLLFSFPNRSLANFLLISYFSLPFFFLFLSTVFSACVFVFPPPSPLAVWKQCSSPPPPFQRRRSSLISCTCKTSQDTPGLSPHL